MHACMVGIQARDVLLHRQPNIIQATSGQCLNLISSLPFEKCLKLHMNLRPALKPLNSMRHETEPHSMQLQPFISEDSNNTPAIDNRHKRRQKWRTSLYWFVFLAVVVLFINIGFLASVVRGRGITGPLGVKVGVLSETSCESTKRANIGVHLVINILSTCLLGASNYCMQCLSAPTRSEVDKAHRTKTWLDIGIPSLHNVASSSLGRRKRLYWWILAISSLPLHLW